MGPGINDIGASQAKSQKADRSPARAALDLSSDMGMGHIVLNKKRLLIQSHNRENSLLSAKEFLSLNWHPASLLWIFFGALIFKMLPLDPTLVGVPAYLRFIMSAAMTLVVAIYLSVYVFVATVLQPNSEIAKIPLSFGVVLAVLSAEVSRRMFLNAYDLLPALEAFQGFKLLFLKATYVYVFVVGFSRLVLSNLSTWRINLIDDHFQGDVPLSSGSGLANNLKKNSQNLSFSTDTISDEAKNYDDASPRSNDAIPVVEYVKFGNSAFLVRDIIAITAKEHYLTIQTISPDSGKFSDKTVRFRLKDASKIMPSDLGALANRSTWLAYGGVLEKQTLSDGRLMITTKSGEMIYVPLSRAGLF